MIDPKRLVWSVVIACFLLGLFTVRSARADESKARRPVVVLRPSSDTAEAWPEGTQAVLAELVAGGYELLLRRSGASDRDGLLDDLVRAGTETEVLGAVAMVREGERGIAYVYTAKNGTVSVEAGVSTGAVGEASVALRIAQILGPPELEVPRHRAAPAPEKPRDVSPKPRAPAERERRSLLGAVTAGLVTTSDLPEPLPIAGLGLRRRLMGPLSIDAAAMLSLGASRIEAPGGMVDISAQEVALHLAFDAFQTEHVVFSLGLGGGVVWSQGGGTASDGFSASRDSASAALLSARAALTFTHADWSLLLAVEPGVLLPAVDVATGGEPARLGRPWTPITVGLGWNF